MISHLGPRRRALVATAVVITALVLWAPSRASSQERPEAPYPPERAGDVVVVNGLEATERLAEGDSATSFSLELPPGAACQGDSANDDYRYNTFVVPADVDPGTLTWDVIGPAGEGNYSLYDVNTNPFVHVFTDVNDGPGRPGPLRGVSQLSFAVFPPGELAAGRYRIGVACDYFAQVTRWWDTQIDVVHDPDAGPAELRWVVVDAGSAAAAGAEGGSTGMRLAIGLVAVVGLGVLGVVVGRALRRRHGADPAPPTEGAHDEAATGAPR